MDFAPETLELILETTDPIERAVEARSQRLGVVGPHGGNMRHHRRYRRRGPGRSPGDETVKLW
ncbi:hypothetical protein [Salipiger thiooxidans]|uniref:hypothetical protein n=1 Tax=Salipiger thiooxidans TaxID=282683 RepID=UPI001CD6E42D|nr:hypothetical protein [Salipiger thiooxidans]MCA0851211.1 hypothetical protein [Salipiger thiooxidans]